MSESPQTGRAIPVTELRADFDRSRVAVLEETFPLTYSASGLDAEDLPAFPRSGSALRRWGSAHVIVQDDVNALALVAAQAKASPLLLPRGEGDRRRFDSSQGNKRHKLDLEAAVVLPDGRLVVFGSGSLPARRRLVLVDPGGRPVVLDADELYVRLASHAAFAGGALNLEGALVRGDELVLLQRGIGSLSSTVPSGNALGFLALEAFLCWLAGSGPVPELTRVVRIELGAHKNVRWGLTDATLQADGSIAFIACAEDSPNAVDDGVVSGCCWGQITDDAAQWVEVVEAGGQPSRLKLEGIESRLGDPNRFDVVADVDDPDAAAVAGTLRVGLRC